MTWAETTVPEAKVTGGGRRGFLSGAEKDGRYGAEKVREGRVIFCWGGSIDLRDWVVCVCACVCVWVCVCRLLCVDCGDVNV